MMAGAGELSMVENRLVLKIGRATGQMEASTHCEVM